MNCIKCNSEQSTGRRFLDGFVCLDCLQPMSLRKALETIIENKDAKSLNWAIGYARLALEYVRNDRQPSDIRNQLLYLKDNISHWRHPQAKDVRAAVKSYITEHKDAF